MAPRKRKGPVRGGADAVGSAVTEDIVMALSQISGLFVTARNATFVYKGKPVKALRVDDDKIGRMDFHVRPTDKIEPPGRLRRKTFPTTTQLDNIAMETELLGKYRLNL